MSTLNMTPLRLSVLRFLADKPNGYNSKGLVQELIPRGSDANLGWTQQGAARMAGKLIGPLREAGLVTEDHWAPMYRRMAKLTESGRAVLVEHESVKSRHELEAAIRSAE